MTIDKEIIDEKIQYDINREAEKKSVQSLEKIKNTTGISKLGISHRWRNITFWSKTNNSTN